MFRGEDNIAPAVIDAESGQPDVAPIATAKRSDWLCRWIENGGKTVEISRLIRNKGYKCCRNLLEMRTHRCDVLA